MGEKKREERREIPGAPGKRGGIWIIALFLLLLSAGGALLFLLPQREFSENENRMLTLRPALTAEAATDGSFQEEFEDFTADQFPFRDGFTALGSLYRLCLGKRDIGGAYFGWDEEGEVRLYEKTDGKSMEKARETLSLLADFAARFTEGNGEPDGANDGNTADGEALDGAGSAPSFSGAPGSTAKKFVFLPVPAAGDLYVEGLPPFAQVFDSSEMIDEASALLTGSGGIVADLRPALLAAKERGEGNLFYRTDHHWTTKGAAAAYLPCCEALGLSPLPDLGGFTRLSDSFSGTLASKVLLPFVKPDVLERANLDDSRVKVFTGSGFAGETLREAKLYAEERLSQKDKYAYFLGGNYGVVLLENEALPEDGGTLLLLKDSFANCFVPYLTAHYRRIVMIDPRYHRGNLGEALESYDPDAVLVLYECANFAGDASLPYFLKSGLSSLSH